MFSKRNCSLKSISMIKILVFLLLSPAKRLSLVNTGDFLGDAVVKTPCCHCKGAWVQSLVIPASGSFPMNQLFPSGGQSIGVSGSASVLPMDIQGEFPSGPTELAIFVSY